MNTSSQTWRKEVRKLVPRDWKVTVLQYSEGEVVYVEPPRWTHSKWLIHCNGTIVYSTEQVQACIDYWESTTSARKEFQEYAEKNKDGPKTINDNLGLHLPRFN